MITDSEYRQLTNLVQENFGIKLGDDKRTMVLHRLQGWIGDQGFDEFKDYFQYLIKDKNSNALMALANRLTTNYSYFYRENEHFEFLRQTALPQKNAQNIDYQNYTLNIWSAGCASGEEPYTIAIILSEFFNNRFSQWDVGILATDIDTNSLKEAHKAVYREDRIKLLPPNLRLQYLKQQPSGYWEISPQIKEMVHFTRYNLMRSHFTFKHEFFAIFCRNVMIYFDRPTIESLVERFYSVTEDKGYLFIGQTESLEKSICPYKYIAPSIYQKA